MPDIRTSLAQEKAINHFLGPAMVIAGPGSGKTFVLTRRIQALIQRYKVSPDKICVITFTKAAANEMRERYLLLDNSSYQVTFGTFHSIFFQLLKDKYSNLKILDNPLKSKIIKQLHEELQVKNNSFSLTYSDISGYISEYKNGNTQSKLVPEEFKEYILKTYNNYVHDYNCIDLDDFASMLYNEFEKDKSFLNNCQKKYDFVLVDEFQDINLAQYNCVKLLCPKNLYGVGDDDQSIYKFRGSFPGIMKQFFEDFDNAAKYELFDNYRSAREIVKESIKIINQNSDRFKKAISAHSTENGVVEICSFSSKQEEIRKAISIIQTFPEENLSEIAMLFRTSMDIQPYIREFKKENIPFISNTKTYNLYKHPLAKAIIAYFMFANNPGDVNSFITIMNIPNRFISTKALNREFVDKASLYAYYNNNRKMIQSLDKLFADIRKIKGYPSFLALKYILKNVGVYNHFYFENGVLKEDDIELYDQIINEFSELSKKSNNQTEFLNNIQIQALLYDQMNVEKRESTANGVKLLTMHASKGLEFDTVIIPNCNERSIPSRKAVTNDAIEEERRLFYVAVTRAKKQLYILYTKEGKKYIKSRFL